MTDDAQAVSDNAKLEDIAKMSIYIKLLYLRICRRMGRHGTIRGFIWIIGFIKALSFCIRLKLIKIGGRHYDNTEKYLSNYWCLC